MKEKYLWSIDPDDFNYLSRQIIEIFRHRRVCGIGAGSDGTRKLNELEKYLNKINYNIVDYYRAGNVELVGGSTIGPRKIITEPSKILIKQNTYAALFFDIGVESGETCLECLRWGALYLPVRAVYFATISDYSGFPQLVSKRYKPYKGVENIFSDDILKKIGRMYSECLPIFPVRLPKEELCEVIALT